MNRYTFTLVTALTATLAAAASAATLPVFSLNVNPDLPVAGSRVTLNVMPTNFTASTTLFTWFRNGVRVDSVSGVGRSAIAMATDPERQQTIQVRVTADPGPDYVQGEQSAIILTLPNPTQQEETLGAAAGDFTLEASKTNPDAGATVNLEVVGFAFDRAGAAYRWYVDGVLDRAQSGRGRPRATITARAEGIATSVRVEVTPAGGITRSKSVTIRAASAPLYWWADTSVPYWYKGKALPSAGSRVTVAAFPNVRNAAELSYRWQVGGGIAGPASGIGRGTFPFRIDLPIDATVSVSISDTAGTFSKTAALSIRPVAPEVGVYEARPLRGVVSERRVRDFSAPAGQPYDFLAVPFFFPKERESALRYRWIANGQELAGATTKPQHLILGNKAGESSETQVSIEASDGRAPAAQALALFRAILR